ncbi:MAG: class I SAM-dependent methyltransferase [Roseibacillus sp.]|jgi:ubiquinone/menaquinone biosynthesis C-methylase UbiE|nr:class I SAM-dependent methyltransferase [Roseibacillus sp.]MDP7307636.1 class I SAM-dependent methyltransferase [Roseibacillus sp.]MDP7494848.1 class I SAM-dependent methyltransferase [Roseibacillus sp.]MDP7654771.1 class I SAM-dependent methyltransferase [Roseibacillus sp.]HJM62326.1 class I SAM-dependent methyltransferase [Roseibacillus sp.]|tara:strand:- start:11227 stop:11991 length:765 start_codon:yes stop_codon:yes gene_type:complete
MNNLPRPANHKTSRSRSGLIVLTIVLSLTHLDHKASGESDQTTRISDPAQHKRTGNKSYPYRAKSEYILKELDLQPGDVVVDVGAGDGFWSEKFAEHVGESGLVHAAEVAEKKVAQMKEKYASSPQIKPCLIESDSTGLAENSCDLAFLSQTYHHLNKDGHVDYLKHLHKVLKPTGRIVIIEKYIETGLGAGTHGTRLSRLIREVEEADWVAVRLEMMTGTYHYLAVLAQKELFPPEPEKEKKTEDKKESQPKK